MGCKAFSPHVVGLAKELEGRPFHLILSHNQRGNGEAALDEAFENGLGLFPSNVTVTKFCQHPGVEGTGYVPYYALFGPDGSLVDHHQGGPYHGGNGEEVLDTIRERVDALPAIYLGETGYEEHASLARAVESGKDRAKALRSLEAALDEAPDSTELKRMAKWVSRSLRRTSIKTTMGAVRDPKATFRGLQALRKDLEGTRWSTVSDGAINPSDEQKKAARAFSKVEKRWLSLKTRRGNGGDVRNPRSAKFREENARSLVAIQKELRELRKAYPDSIAAAESFVWLHLLDDDSAGGSPTGK